MSKHTPGPWQVKDFSNHSRIVNGEGREVACLPFWGDSEDTANVRLMAKSPEMVELLCEVIFSYQWADDLDDRIEACLEKAGIKVPVLQSGKVQVDCPTGPD